MGYDLVIGDAFVVPGEADSPSIRVWAETVRHPDAPRLSGESEQHSYRSPSYTGWAHFCRDAGIYDLFYGDAGLLARHPGAATILPEHLVTVREALARHLAKPWPAGERICGWEEATAERDWRAINDTPDPRYDGTWARLVWLEFWFDWALQNCKNPCFANM